MRIWHQSFTDLDMVPVYERTLAEHAARVTDAGTSVILHGLKPGTYGSNLAPIDALRHPYIEFLNEVQICEAVLTAEREEYDAFALGCFHDPALRQARSLVSIPVVGLSETCMLIACSLGKKFALIALNRDQQARHEDLAEAYGLERRLAKVVPMNPPIDEYMLESDGEATVPVVKGFKCACQEALGAGAEVIIPGDGVLNEFVYRRGLLNVEGAIVIDALGVLFRYAAFMAGVRSALGIEVSRRQHYARPSTTMLEHVRSSADMRAWREEEFSGVRKKP
jgi:allantoin racemase